MRKGRDMRRAVGRCSAVILCALMLIPGAVTTVSAASEVWNARMRFPSAGQQMLYVQVRSTGELRIADSPDTLATATPVEAQDRSEHKRGPDELSQYLTFPEVSLPVSLKGVEKVSAVISFSRNRGRQGRKGPVEDQSTIGVRISMSRRDGAGVKWTYLSTVETPKTPTRLVVGMAPDRAPIIEMPDLGDLKLTVETKIEGTKARIALRAKAGDVALDKVMKGGRYPACTLQVLNTDGKVLHAAKGDLEKFGFT